MKLKLFAKMMVFILVPAVLGIASLAVISSTSAENALEKQIFEDMSLLVDSQSHEVSNMLMALRGATDTLSEVNRIVLYLQALKEKQAPSVIEPLALGVDDSIATTTANFKRIKYGGVIDAQGILVRGSRAEMIGTNFKNESFFARTLQSGSTIATVRDKITNRLVILITSVVRKDKDVLGMVYVQVDMEQLIAGTVGNIKVGESGRCFVYNEKGLMLMHVDTPLLGVDHSNTPWVLQARKETKGQVYYTFKDSTRIGFYTRIPNTDWIAMLSVTQEELLAPINAMTRQSIVVSVITVLIVGLIICLIARGIAKVLRDGAAFAQCVAAGNLEVSPEQKVVLGRAAARTDEIGELASGMAIMVENLIKTVGEAKSKTKEAEVATEKAHIATQEAEAARTAAESAKREGMLAAAGQLEAVVEIVTSASTELSAQIEQSERGSGEQAARLAETATAMEEMNSTVLEVAKNAGLAADVSATTRTNASDGSDIVVETIKSIGAVQQQSLALKEDMVALGQQAEAISHVMSVISDIADQTNLLALNAAIEAARAGDAGRGFAVVADEVRKLAEKTMHSTVDVSTAVKNIQTSAVKNMEQVDLAVSTIAKANELAEKSGAALHNIVKQADHTADQVRAIATASEEQSATSEEITRSITQVNVIATETSRAMQEAAQAVSDLAHQAQILNNLIAEMKRG
ncbi:MAG: methyl-accepting chemotaxis protein [Desulfovibrionaceae bacterium]